MDRKEALADLIAKVEAGDDFLFGGGMGDMCGISDDNWTLCYYAFHGSLDAALALHQAVLPGWNYTIKQQASVGARMCVEVTTPPTGGNREYHYGYGPEIPARAWLLSILKALHAQEQETTQ